MGYLDFIDKTQLAEKYQGRETVPSTSIWQVIPNAFTDAIRNTNVGAKDFATGFEERDRDSYYNSVTGRNLFDDALAALPDIEREELLGSTVDIPIPGKNRRTSRPIPSDKQAEIKDRYIEQLQAQYAENPQESMWAHKLQTRKQIEESVKQKAKEKRKEYEKIAEGASGAARFFGTLAGGIGASFLDPLNMATLPLGAFRSAGIVSTALIEGAINAATEVASFPLIKSWQEELGQEYGLKDLAFGVAAGTGFGAIFGGGAKAFGKYVEHSRAVALRNMLDNLNEFQDRDLRRALMFESRRLYLDEARPRGMTGKQFTDVLMEVHDAILENRAVDWDKFDFDVDASFRTDAVHEGQVRVQKRIMDETAPRSKQFDPDAPENRNKKATLGDNLNDRNIDPEIGKEMETAEFYSSEEYVKTQEAELKDLIQKRRETDPDFEEGKALIADEDGIEIDGEVRQSASEKEIFDDFEAEKKIQQAISVCGNVGGGS